MVTVCGPLLSSAAPAVAAMTGDRFGVNPAAATLALATDGVPGGVRSTTNCCVPATEVLAKLSVCVALAV